MKKFRLPRKVKKAAFRYQPWTPRVQRFIRRFRRAMWQQTLTRLGLRA